MAFDTRLPKALESSLSEPSRSTDGAPCSVMRWPPAESASASAFRRSSRGRVETRSPAGRGVGARVEAELRGGGVVAPFDVVFAVEHHHAVGQRLRGAAKARQRFLELALAAHAGALVLVQRAQHFVPSAAAFRHPARYGVSQPA